MFIIISISQSSNNAAPSQSKDADTKKAAESDKVDKDALLASIEKYKKEYADYWKDIIGVDGDFDLKAEKEEVE